MRRSAARCYRVAARFVIALCIMSPIIRYIVVSLGVLALMGASSISLYFKGRSDCAVKHARKASQEAAEWAEKVQASSAAAYEKGREAAILEQKNREKVDEIGEFAAEEPGADDLCLSADVVDRLRELE